MCEFSWMFDCYCRPQNCYPLSAGQLFQRFDGNNDCCLDWEEFQRLMEDLGTGSDEPDEPVGPTDPLAPEIDVIPDADVPVENQTNNN